MSDRTFSSRYFAREYHERTKYDPKTLAAKSRPLEWDQQPSPYKDYKLGTTIDLKPYLVSTLADPAETWWWRLSRLLFCTYGLTARVGQSNLVLRAAPSAGGLYPAEVYLLSRGTPELPAGLYNYQVKTHSLVRFWDGEFWAQLQNACFNHPALVVTEVAIVVSSVFFRSAWRYQDRAYRRIGLDTGHVLGNLELASALTDFRPHLIGGFEDGALNDLFFFEPDLEGSIVVAALADRLDRRQYLNDLPTALASPPLATVPEDLIEGELLAALHHSSQIPAHPAGTPRPSYDSQSEPSTSADKYNLPFGLKVPAVGEAIDWGDGLGLLERTILQRRSTRAYTSGAISSDDLKAILQFAYQPQTFADQGLDPAPDYFDLGLIATFVVVRDVYGLEAGCYYYAPTTQELRQIRFKNFQEEMHFLCLGQDLGHDAAAVVVQTADLVTAIDRWGDRAYRYLHLDSGHLGQRLNLAALRLGLGVSGIAGFFDDLVNEVLGIPEGEAVLYLTTIGQPR